MDLIPFAGIGLLIIAIVGEKVMGYFNSKKDYIERNTFLLKKVNSYLKSGQFSPKSEFRVLSTDKEALFLSNQQLFITLFNLEQSGDLNAVRFIENEIIRDCSLSNPTSLMLKYAETIIKNRNKEHDREKVIFLSKSKIDKKLNSLRIGDPTFDIYHNQQTIITFRKYHSGYISN